MIKRFLAFLFAWLFLISQVAASDWVINSYRFAPPPNPTITFLQCVPAEVTGNPASFTSVNVGTASANRFTIIGIEATDSAGSFSVTGVTVGGDAATEAVDQGSTTGQFVNAAIYILANPAGTSETIAVTNSEPVNATTICVWSATDLLSITPTGTNSAGTTSGATMTLSVTGSANGVAVGVCGSSDSAVQTGTWTGFTKNDDNDSGSQQISVAMDTTITTGSNAATCVMSGGGHNVGASAAFR